MALIINADMPTSCGYACDLWSEGLCVPLQKSVDAHTIDSDCPILCEIPDKHGRLIDADAFKNNVADMRMEKPLRNGAKQVIEIGGLFGRIIDEAPTIVEATE